MAGYFDNDAATRAVIQDGWFRSGDLGRLDADGYLFVQGRVKDIIVLSSGKKISAEEVGNHYLQAPAVKEIFVLPDAREEKLVAVIFPDFDYLRRTGETDAYNRVKWYLDLLFPAVGALQAHPGLCPHQPGTAQNPAGQDPHAGSRQNLPGPGRQSLRSQKIRPDRKSLRHRRRRHPPAPGKNRRAGSLPWTTTWNWTWAWTPWPWWNWPPPWKSDFSIAVKEDGFADLFTVGELIRFVESQEPQGQETTVLKQRSWAEILRQEPPPELREQH